MHASPAGAPGPTTNPPAATPGTPEGRLARLLGGVAAWLRRHTHALLVANVVAQVVIVATGGAVRLTASGLGCSTWPQCEPGEFTPVLHDETTYHPIIEFGNRTLTGVLTVVALAVAVAVWTDRTRSDRFRLLGLVPLAGVLAQALLGGITVLVDLHPAVVSSHFLLSMVLVSVSTLLLHRWAEGDGAPVVVVDRATRTLAHVLAGLAVVVLVLGTVTTGAGPHSGDSEVGYRFAVDPLVAAKVHAAAVWAYGAVLLAVVWRTRAGSSTGKAARRAHRASIVLLVISVAQGAIGYVQVATDLPILLVNLHLVGAALMTAGTTRVWLCTRQRSAVTGSADTAAVAAAPVA